MTCRSCPWCLRSCRPTANVGWSHNLTPTLSTAGAMVLVVLMYVGRIGSLMVALSVPEVPDRRYRFVEAGVRIG